jgi:hypothetical protein
MRRLAGLPLVLALVTVACSATPVVQPTATFAAPTSAPPPLAPSDTPAPSPTSPPTATSTPTASPTPEPDVRIQPGSLSQIRLRWSISDPGKGLSLTNMQCDGTSCDTASRIGAYSFSADSSLLAVGVCTGDLTENKSDRKQPRYSCSAGSEVQLYSVVTGKPSGSVAVGAFPLSLAFDAQDENLAVGMSDGMIDVWDLTSSARVQQLHHTSAHAGVTSLAFVPDGRQLISQGDGHIMVWDRSTGQALKTMDGWGRMSLDSSGQRLVTGWYDSATIKTIVRVIQLTGSGKSQDIHPKFVEPNIFDVTIEPAFIHGDSEILVLGPNGAEWWDAAGARILGHTDVDKLIGSKTDAFSPIGAITSDGLVLTEPGIGLAVPGVAIPIPSYGTPTCGFALWDPTVPGAYVSPLGSGGCPVPLIMGDGRRAVISPDDHLIAADNGAGELRLWAVDPAAESVPPICLGKCAGS